MNLSTKEQNEYQKANFPQHADSVTFDKYTQLSSGFPLNFQLTKFTYKSLNMYEPTILPKTHSKNNLCYGIEPETS